MAAYDACISLAGIVVDLVIIMAVLTVSRACNIRSCLIGVMYLRPDAYLVVLFHDNASASWLCLPGMCTADMENPKCASIENKHRSKCIKHSSLQLRLPI